MGHASPLDGKDQVIGADLAVQFDDLFGHIVGRADQEPVARQIVEDKLQKALDLGLLISAEAA